MVEAVAGNPHESLDRPRLDSAASVAAAGFRAPGNGTEPGGAAPAAVEPAPAHGRNGGPASDVELREWVESIDYVYRTGGAERLHQVLRTLHRYADAVDADLPFTANTPYVNTIPPDREPPYPGDRAVERRNKSIIRWNAMAMVVRANESEEGIGGHISTFASAATLLEVAQNHFLRGPDSPQGGDQVYFQGHAAPGMYARAFLEGRLSEEQLTNFRRELASGGGLSSYPHPWLMPDFWSFPTVSMGLSPIQAIYQARFNRYLQDRGIKRTDRQKVWAFLGDGEMDEPESLGSITLAARERLDNLIFVVNCNLQRLDGPVRGNGKIIQELEAAFRGAGWNVIKVIWGGDWDPLLAADRHGLLARRMEETVDGQYQKYTVESGAYIREHFFGTDPRLLELVRNYSDDDLRRLYRGGHDPAKVHAAFKAAVEHRGEPTVVLAKTIKGYGLGEAGEGKNITHQQKKLNQDELVAFRVRFDIPISDEEAAAATFYLPDEHGGQRTYLRARRQELGGYLPARAARAEPLTAPPAELFAEFLHGTDGREASSTMAFVRILTKLLRDKRIGPLIVPIVPDEARTFGMEPLFRQVGIYSSVGQLYEPVDRENLLYYKEAKDGQVLEEGITEAGSFSSFIAAGNAYATHGINTIPFFIYYSMFGFQRIGDLIWAAADLRCKGFFLGGTSGRTTLNGEGLQHQDGHSHVAALAVPTLRSYDPTYAYELAVIIEDGIRRMYVDQEEGFYYLTVMNENYAMPPIPEPAEETREGILRGLYRFSAGDPDADLPKAHLLGSGAILNESVRAAELLAEQGVSADVWSVTSYQQLYRDICETERRDLLDPGPEPRRSYVARCFAGERGVFVAATDYLRVLPALITDHLPGPVVRLGTDGFGRSDTRGALRDHFEVSARYIALAALRQLHADGSVDRDALERGIRRLDVDPDKIDPLSA